MFYHNSMIIQKRVGYIVLEIAEIASELNLAQSSGTACSSAARLRIRPALICDNAKLIRMRAEITAEKMLPNQKGKGPEGAQKHLRPCGWSRARLQHVRNTKYIIYCMVTAIHLSL